MFHFNLPLLGRPILWYGFLFALGFFLGYGVLLYLLRRYFLFFPQFREEEIASWPDLIHSLKLGKLKQLSPGLEKKCKEWKAGMPISQELKKEILHALNLAVPIHHVLSSSLHRLLAFGKKRISDQAYQEIVNRLKVEALLGISLHSLKKRTSAFAESLLFYVIIGAVVGARLGDVLFYQDLSHVFCDPLSIIAVWKGGLASHGGGIGILMALYLFVKKKRWAYWRVLDVVVVPTALAAVFIRIGNFMNQEILGTASTLPWAVVFMHPADGSAVIPRHPVQLYEAAWYLFSFCILLWYWRSHFSKQIMGKVSGLFLLLIFGFRFVIEAFKLEQSAYLSQGAFLTMGQYLSLPFIALGLWLFFFRRESR